MNIGSACVLICDTGVKHRLAASAYNERRQQCEQGVEVIGEYFPGVRSLRDVTWDMLQTSRPRLSAVVLRRCRHVLEENWRTQEVAKALVKGALTKVGDLMKQSHRSLRDDYEVSCPELDAAVDAANGLPGMYGSRMTGGGFGGCTVTLVETHAVERVSAAIQARFAEQFSIEPRLFVSSAQGGVREHP